MSSTEVDSSVRPGKVRSKVKDPNSESSSFATPRSPEDDLDETSQHRQSVMNILQRNTGLYNIGPVLWLVNECCSEEAEQFGYTRSGDGGVLFLYIYLHPKVDKLYVSLLMFECL